MSSPPPPSTPLDVSAPFNADNVRGTTILITGGAGGLGAAMFRALAPHGACVIIGDINKDAGTKLVASLRKETGNDNLHFVACDVTSWEAQLRMFKEALLLSPTGKVNTVIANAGMARLFLVNGNLPESPHDDPSEPKLKTVDVNLKGVIYTSRLFLHYSRLCNEGEEKHLVFVGSIASISNCPGIAVYSATKHAVLGLFRSLRTVPGQADGVRMNMIAPYFADTPMMGHLTTLLSGLEMTDVEDVVTAAQILVCSPGVHGRTLAILPKKAGGIMEIAVGDQEDLEGASRRLVAALNAVSRVQRVVRTVKDVSMIVGPVGFAVVAALTSVMVYMYR